MTRRRTPQLFFICSSSLYNSLGSNRPTESSELPTCTAQDMSAHRAPLLGDPKGSCSPITDCSCCPTVPTYWFDIILQGCKEIPSGHTQALCLLHVHLHFVAGLERQERTLSCSSTSQLLPSPALWLLWVSKENASVRDLLGSPGAIQGTVPPLWVMLKGTGWL